MATPLVPPFTFETATAKVRMAEDAWNSRDPVRLAGAYTEDSRWRNRAEFFQGRPAIVASVGTTPLIVTGMTLSAFSSG